MKLFSPITQHYHNHGKVCPTIVVDVETILVSCPSTVASMFYPGTFLAKNCSNTYVESVNDSSKYVGRYTSYLPFMLYFKSARVWGLFL